jgi:hypothetical protein
MPKRSRVGRFYLCTLPDLRYKFYSSMRVARSTSGTNASGNMSFNESNTIEQMVLDAARNSGRTTFLKPGGGA